VTPDRVAERLEIVSGEALQAGHPGIVGERSTMVFR
jgi:hypothetical protein